MSLIERWRVQRLGDSAIAVIEAETPIPDDAWLVRESDYEALSTTTRGAVDALRAADALANGVTLALDQSDMLELAREYELARRPRSRA